MITLLIICITLKYKKTGRGAVWLAHQYGVLGVGGSNPLVPTIYNLKYSFFFNKKF